MAARHLALVLGIAAALGGACAEDGTVNPLDTSSTTAAGGSGGRGGAGGEGGGAAGSSLLVGVGKQVINPTFAEKLWNDANDNDHYDPGEEFADTNMNGKFDAVWMAGFGNGRPATGQSDDLEARAIAMKNGDMTVVLCVLDVVGFFSDDMDAIRMDPVVTALGVDHVLIGSTHTHQGADTIGLWGPTDMETGLNPEYQKLVRDRAALAIKEAVESLKPARMKIAQAVTVDPESKSTKAYVNDTRDPIIYDPTLTIAQFTDDADPTKTLATLVNWAAHPEYAGDENNLLSSDYAHWLREVIEKGVEGEGVAGLGGVTVFVQGPLGGQVGPGGGVAPIGPNGSPITEAGLPKAQAVGTNVAKLALEAIKTGEDATSTEITLRTKEVYASVDNVAYQLGLEFGIFSRALYMYDPEMPVSETNLPWVKSRVTYLQVGPLATVTAPGELHPELWVGGYEGGMWSWGQDVLTETENAPDLTMAPKGPYLRDVMLTNPGVKYAFVAGLTEDFNGYIIPSFNYVLHPENPYLEEAAGDHYEETNSLGPKVEEQLVTPMFEIATPATP